MYRDKTKLAIAIGVVAGTFFIAACIIVFLVGEAVGSYMAHYKTDNNRVEIVEEVISDLIVTQD